jgi:sigma-B regulation protein RsbU (phosphoserine phosphatase)
MDGSYPTRSPPIRCLMSSSEMGPSKSASREGDHSASASEFTAKVGSARTGDLASQVVEVARVLSGAAGACLRRMMDGKPTVWYQTGEIPQACEAASEAHFPDDASPGSISRWVYPLAEAGSGDSPAVLEVYGEKPLHRDTYSSLKKFACIAGLAVSRANEQQTIEDLSAILEATKLLNSTLDLPELLNIILQLCTHLCGADRGTVFLVDRERGEIWSLKGLGLEKYEIRLPMERGIAGWVATHGEPVRIEDAPIDPRFDPTVDRDVGYQTRELLAQPIRNEDGEIVGVLELLNKRVGPFNAADEKSLDHLSVHVATALEKARLHREILAKQRMENDLALARTVQRGLLPESPPELEGFEFGVAYRPSLMVGGDYYDFMRLMPDSLLAVIADVEGKGVASALMMANLHALLHALATHVHSLEVVVKSVNDTIIFDTRAQKLLCMFVAVIDERQRVLHYINAGHLPPAVLHPNGQSERLDEGGIILGASADAIYTRGRVQLQSGDIFVACTDGITEAREVAGEEYGLQRLLSLVHTQRAAPAKQIVESVLLDVGRFCAEGSDDDDRVVLIFKVS